MTAIAYYDTETCLITPGRTAPELVCVQVCIDQSDPILLDASDGAALYGGFLDQRIPVVGHNVAYDQAVMAAHCPDFLPAIFEAYRAGRVHCTQVRENLIRAAMGTHRGEHIEGEGWKPAKYDLAALAWRYGRMKLDKPAKDGSDDDNPDFWRKRYGTLRGIPIAQWPAGAVKYALEDAVATRLAYQGQEALLAQADPQGLVLVDAARQTFADFALRLASNWGIRSDRESVALLKGEVEAARDELAGELIDLGLVRPDHSRDMKAVHELIGRAFEAEGRAVPRTESWNDGREYVKKTGTWRDRGHYECVATGAEVLIAVDDPRLARYARFVQLGAILSKDVPMLERGVDLPIHTRFAFAVTGRSTSSSPNVQNFGQQGGVRECIVARPGHVILQLDMPGLELHTFAECAVEWLGGSRMCELLNAGVDVHSDVGARFAGVTYAEFLPEKEGKYKRFRKVAKPFNFGRLGGMGEDRFLEFAKGKPYFVKLTHEEYEIRNRQWLEALPEAEGWFALAKRRFEGLGCKCRWDREEKRKAGRSTCPQCGRPMSPRVTVQHLYSGRWRGDCGYTDACNSPFQGLGADVTKAVTCEISSACYVDRRSALIGCRLINYIHDEWLIEVPDDSYLHERAETLVDLVHEHSNRWLKHAPFRREDFSPMAMRRWDKNAATKRDERGRLVVWEA